MVVLLTYERTPFLFRALLLFVTHHPPLFPPLLCLFLLCWKPPFVLRHRPPVSSSSVESPACEDPSISDGLLPEDSAPSSVTAEKLLRASITDRQFLYLRLACVALILPFYLGVDPLFLCVVSVLFHLTFLRSVFASLISAWVSKRSIALQDLMGGWSDLVDITARVKGCYSNFCLWFVALGLAGWALYPLSPLSPL